MAVLVSQHQCYSGEIVKDSDFLDLAFDLTKNQNKTPNPDLIKEKMDLRSFNELASGSFILQFESLDYSHQRCSQYINIISNVNKFPKLILGDTAKIPSIFLRHIDLVTKTFSEADAKDLQNCIAKLDWGVQCLQAFGKNPGHIPKLLFAFCEIAIAQGKNNSFIDSTYANLYLQGHDHKSNRSSPEFVNSYYEKLLSRYQDLFAHPASEIRLAALNQLVKFYDHFLIKLYDHFTDFKRTELLNFIENYKSDSYLNRLKACVMGILNANNTASSQPKFWQNLCEELTKLRDSDTNKDVQNRAAALLDIHKFYKIKMRLAKPINDLMSRHD